jgi:hypothetical protein
VKLPAHWYISQTTLRSSGRLLLISAFYLWACAFAKRRHLTIKGQRLVLPSWRFALLQMAVSAPNWMAMGAIIWLLMAQQVDYFLVLGVLLVSSIAGVIVHIPAGIGVLEAVFIAMLSGEEIRAARLSPPCWPGARCTSCRCCWRPSAICCWRVGRKHCAKESAQAGGRISEMAGIIALPGPGAAGDKALTTVAENTQQHQEQVDKVQIQRQRAKNRVFTQR